MDTTHQDLAGTIVADVMLPIIRIVVGDDAPIMVTADWNPEFRERVDQAVENVNQRIRDGKFAFVDDEGLVHKVPRRDDLNEGLIRAVAETITRKLRGLAIPIVHPLTNLRR